MGIRVVPRILNYKLKKIKRDILKKIRRMKRARAKIYGTAKRPRLCVSKSNKHIYAQLIDDEAGRTIAAADDKEGIKIDDQSAKISPSWRDPAMAGQIKNKKTEGKEEFLSKKIEIGREMGKLIAKKAIEKGIEKAVFDRRGGKYCGIIKAVAEGAREGGLKL